MNDHLNWRYATKKFDPSKRIPKQELSELLDVLRFSPSSFGLQPWKFIIIHDPVLRKKLRLHAWDQAQVTDAGTLIVFCALRNIDENYVKQYVERFAKIRGVSRESSSGYEAHMIGFLKAKSPEDISRWMRDQVYLALGFFLAECSRRNIDACPMEGFDPGKFDDILDLSKEGLESIVLCTIGYRANDDQYAQFKKVRFEKSEVFIERN